MFFFFFNDTATTEIYTLSLHDALPICLRGVAATGDRDHPPSYGGERPPGPADAPGCGRPGGGPGARGDHRRPHRSEEHTSELQSRQYLVCRLLLEKKKHNNHISRPIYT